MTRKTKLVLVVALVVLAFGICFTTCKPEERSISINFIGWTNGPQGQMLARFDVSLSGYTGREFGTRAMPKVLMIGCSEPYPLPVLNAGDPYKGIAIPECAHHFRCEMAFFVLGRKDRLRRIPLIGRTPFPDWITKIFGGDGGAWVPVISPWIYNPNQTNHPLAIPLEQ